MVAANDIFEKGPDAVAKWFSQARPTADMDELEMKQLADICWTRANSLSKSARGEARRWAKAALAGYEFLGTHAKPLVADSANETADMLRSWKLLREHA